MMDGTEMGGIQGAAVSPSPPLLPSLLPPLSPPLSRTRAPRPNLARPLGRGTPQRQRQRQRGPRVAVASGSSSALHMIACAAQLQGHHIPSNTIIDDEL